MELCPDLGLTIPVGKDSMSMTSRWYEENEEKSVTAPLSLIISAFSKIPDARIQITPLLDTSIESELFLIDLGLGKNRMGGSCLAQVFNHVGNLLQILMIQNYLLTSFHLLTNLIRRV